MHPPAKLINLKEKFGLNGTSGVHETVVKTYKAIIKYTNAKGSTTTLGTFNVTRDGWFRMGTDKNGNDIYVNRSSDPANNSKLNIEGKPRSEQYGIGTPSYTISEIFSPIPKEYNQGFFDHGKLITSQIFDSEVKRANGYSPRYAKFHVGGMFTAGKDEGEDYGKKKIGETYRCYGIVDPTQVSKFNIYDIDPYLKTPSNAEMQRFGTSIDEAIKMQINEHGVKIPVQVEIQKRDYEKIKILKPGNAP